MIHIPISKGKKMGFFQNDALVMFSIEADNQRMIFTHEEMDIVCKKWEEYKKANSDVIV